MEKVKQRNSNIELVKILAIILIIIAHMADSVSSFHESADARLLSKFFIDKSLATTDINLFLINILCYFGRIGNTIFFLSTCYFLCDRKKTSLRKVVRIVLDAWIISMLFLGIIVFTIPILKKDFYYSFFPTILVNNWYITVYLLIYLIYPYINKWLDRMSQKAHKVVSIILMIFMSTVLLIIDAESTRPRLLIINLITFVIIYIFYNYLIKYRKDFIENKKKNIIMIIIGAICLISCQIVLNIIGLKSVTMMDKMLVLNGNQNIFAIMIGMGITNIAISSPKKESSIINSISSLSLYIYLIHDNLLFRTYIKPWMFVYINKNYGYDYIILWILTLSVMIYVLSCTISYVYKNSIGKVTYKISNINKKEV